MPLYEYECQQCSHRLEVIQRFADPPRTVCPECGGALRKLLSAPAVQFKGSGWYVTDYGGKKATSGAEPKRSEDSGKDSKAESKSDSKSDGGSKPDGDGKSAGESRPGKSETSSAPAAAPKSGTD